VNLTDHFHLLLGPNALLLLGPNTLLLVGPNTLLLLGPSTLLLLGPNTLLIYSYLDSSLAWPYPTTHVARARHVKDLILATLRASISRLQKLEKQSVIKQGPSYNWQLLILKKNRVSLIWRYFSSRWEHPDMLASKARDDKLICKI
jgi:hypothetical protein